MRLLLTFSAIAALVVSWADAQEDPAPRASEISGLEVVPRIGDADKKDKGSPGEGGVSHSRTKQFVVHAKESAVRGAFCVFCEEVKAELLTLLRQPDAWKIPMHIHVRGHTSGINRGEPVRSSVRVIDGGSFSMVVVVELGDAFTREKMRSELITLLLAEQIVRAKPGAEFTRSKVLPDWLRIGVSEAIEYRRRGRPTALFSSIFKSGKMLSVNDMIYAKPETMNSVSEAIYRASCCGFVLALVGQDVGPQRLRAMIADLAVFKGSDTALLEKHFPGTGDSKNSLEKWWLLELATMAQPTVKDILDPVESESALGKCLQVRYLVKSKIGQDGDSDDAKQGGRRKIWQVFRPRKEVDEGGDAEGDAPPEPQFRSEVVTADLSEYRTFMDREDHDALLQRVEVALLQLSWRAFPLHRPMIQEYQVMIEMLRQGKTRGLDERFAKLAATRVALARASSDATDFLHHHQATKTGRLSGAFEDYEAAVEELNRPRPPRTDGLSKYLDALDKEYR